MKLSNVLKHFADGSAWGIIGRRISSHLPKRLDNRNIAFLQEEWKTYRKFEKRYRKFIENYQIPDMGASKKPDIVWILWLQGYEKAPALVKACINSVRTNNPDKKVILLDEQSLSQYCHLPDYIIEKYKKGIIPNAHYSDLIRASLLAEHGGTWCDATVFSSEKFPSYIESSPLFVFKELELGRRDIMPTVCSSWFISALPNEPILALTRDVLFDYWKEAKILDNYFVFHIVFALAARHFKKEWDAVPAFNNCSPHTLQFEFDKPYNEERWNQIMAMSPIHKLNHHIDYAKNEGETNYAHLLALYDDQDSE